LGKKKDTDQSQCLPVISIRIFLTLSGRPKAPQTLSFQHKPYDDFQVHKELFNPRITIPEGFDHRRRSFGLPADPRFYRGAFNGCIRFVRSSKRLPWFA